MITAVSAAACYNYHELGSGIDAWRLIDSVFRVERYMAILKFLDTGELEEFAVVLATDLWRRFPPSSEKRTDSGAAHQIKVILEGLAARAVRYHEQHKLGVYKKAKLANVFKWKLKELGYSPQFIEHATKEIVTRLAIKK
jgi:hypothetical protein